MADGLSAATANLCASAAVTDAGWVGMAVGAPGANGTANPSSVTTRMQVTWGSPSGGAIAATNEPAWTSWAGTNGEVVSDLVFFSASTSGTFGFSCQLNANVTMDTGDSLTLTSLQVSFPVAS